MDKTDILILSGIFAVSNMGQKLPELHRVVDAVRYPPKNAHSSACIFAEQYMESYEHEKIFEDEVKMWVKYLGKKKDLELYKKSSPDIFTLFNQAKEQVNEEARAKS